MRSGREAEGGLQLASPHPPLLHACARAPYLRPYADRKCCATLVVHPSRTARSVHEGRTIRSPSGVSTTACAARVYSPKKEPAREGQVCVWVGGVWGVGGEGRGCSVGGQAKVGRSEAPTSVSALPSTLPPHYTDSTTPTPPSPCRTTASSVWMMSKEQGTAVRYSRAKAALPGGGAPKLRGGAAGQGEAAEGGVQQGRRRRGWQHA